MTTLARQAVTLRCAVRQALAELSDDAVPVRRRVAEAAETLEALGDLADTLLRITAALEAPRRRRRKARPRVVH